LRRRFRIHRSFHLGDLFRPSLNPGREILGAAISRFEQDCRLNASGKRGRRPKTPSKCFLFFPLMQCYQWVARSRAQHFFLGAFVPLGYSLAPRYAKCCRKCENEQLPSGRRVERSMIGFAAPGFAACATAPIDGRSRVGNGLGESEQLGGLLERRENKYRTILGPRQEIAGFL